MIRAISTSKHPRERATAVKEKKMTEPGIGGKSQGFAGQGSPYSAVVNPSCITVVVIVIIVITIVITVIVIVIIINIFDGIHNIKTYQNIY